MTSESIRNVAIIAHVDHGKTTLVDQLLRQSGQFRQSEVSGECILDSNPLERERGITILAKNCAIDYTDRKGRQFHINIVDTPGHADFSGEVERVLRMADGVLLLVDAAEGVMPQTRYVLSKALALGLKPVVIINKMDRPDAQHRNVLSEVFDLLVDLGADEHALNFPTIYASGREGWAAKDPTKPEVGSVHDVFDAIIEHIHPPQLDGSAPLQALITTLDYNDYVGRIAIGRVFAGTMRAGEDVVIIDREGKHSKQRISQLFRFDGLGRKEVDHIDVGDLFALVGLDKFEIGNTIADLSHPIALPTVAMDLPTIQMAFRVNDSPFSGREGKYVTGRQVRDRLLKEVKSNVALRVEDRGDEIIVSGRGVLHLGILLENMRREGYELTVGKPEVIYEYKGDKKLEPLELLVVDAPNDSIGAVMQLLGDRHAEMVNMEVAGNHTHLEFKVPARGLIGLRSNLLTATKGEAIMHHRFMEYGDFRGEIPGRINGVMIATETGQVTTYALDQLADRGIMFVEPGAMIYEGQIVGEYCKDKDIPVNVVRQRKLTNMRKSTKEMMIILKTPKRLELEDALEYIDDDELVEITPDSIRLRKRRLTDNDRRRERRHGPALD
ncbi:MAG: translational GTPase TypA [Dehalococcoidia bacterium]|nr:translational GTPase TypA [Dehalococcoidia bacterium]